LISDLRNRIREIDEEIVRLAAERISIAEEIGQIKVTEGLQIRDLEVEKKVLDRYRDASEGTLLDILSAEEMAKILIRNSVEVQAALPRKRSSIKSVCVIGGKGKMGQWISGLLEGSGHSVTILDAGDDLMKASECDAVVISVPISAVRGILEQLDSICKEQLIFDISSLKSPFMDVLKDMGSRKKVCSLHPMFGPSARSMYDRNIIVCDCGNDSAVKDAIELIGDHGENIMVMDISEHDRHMSYVLGLSHAVNIAFFTALERSNIPFKDFERTASTTFRKNLDTNMSVASEDASLYYEIQNLNINSSEVWKEFSDAVEDVRKASLNGDPKSFLKLMDNGRMFFEKE
jgi:Prephenate dehydrogenase